MDQHQMLTKIESLVEQSKVGLLATTDPQGKPRVRWMTPAIIPNRGPSIYAFSAANAMKIRDIEHQSEVKWLVQTHDLTQVVSARGDTYILDNPALKTEILEILIPHTTRLWTIDLSSTECVILETVIREATYYRPQENFEETVTFV